MDGRWGRGGGGGAPDIDFPSNGVQLLSWLPISQFGAQNTTASTVEGYVSPGGHEFAIVGVSDGTGFVDVTDPGNAQIVGFIGSVTSLWRDIRVYQHYCYTVSEGGGGIQVIDMGQIDSGIVTLVGNVNTPGSASTHTVFLNQDSGYIYRCGGGSTLGLRIYSLTNPASPTFVGTALTSRYVHECQVVNYTVGPYAGKEIAFCYSDSNSGGGSPAVDILDVTNKAAIVPLSTTLYPNPKFSHQGWLSPDRHYIYVDDELDQQNGGGGPTMTRIIDVSNLSSPFYVGTFDNGAGSIDHNLYTLGNLIFESNYRSGLRVFDATNPIAPVEIAYFDTYPTDNGASFNGLWDNYPYLPSGIVLGSDIEKGLFVWRVGPALLAFNYPDGHPAMISPGGDSFPVTITNQAGTLQSGTAKLWYDTGSGYTSVNLVATGGGNFNAVFPAIACTTTVKYYITAQTTTGVTVKSPAGAPSNFFQTFSATGQAVGFTDNMETDNSWVVGAPGDSAVTGIWTRVDPVGTAAQPEDDDPAGTGTMCWVTGQGVPGGGVGDNDIDGGATTLTSPAIDATAGADPYIVFYRWYSNDQGSSPNTDSMPVMLSNDNGSTWTQIELVTENAGAWVRKSFRVANFMSPTNGMRVRFVARDLDPPSVVEAGLDDVSIVYYDCTVPVAGDVNGDGIVNVDDLLAVINAWGVCPKPPAACPADIAPPGPPQGNGVVNVDDLLAVINNWTN